MIISTLMAFLHFLSAFGLVSTVILERVLLKPTLSAQEVSRLGKIDGIYGLSAIIVLTIGLLRVFYFEKGRPYFGTGFSIFKGPCSKLFDNFADSFSLC